MFSLNWFTTVPGILITVGVLLLVVALIIFIVTSINDKKRAKGEVNTPVNVVDNSNIPAVQAVDVPAPSVYSTNVVSAQNVNSNVAVPEVGSMEEAARAADLNAVPPVTDFNASIPGMKVSPEDMVSVYSGNTLSTPTVEPVVEVSSVAESPVVAETAPVETTMSEMPSVTETPVMPEVSTMPKMPVMPEVNVQVETPVIPEVTAMPEMPTMVAPSVEQVVPEMQDVEAPSISIDAVASVPETQIYGGATPVVPEIKEEEHHEIYGGANPLENTQSVPISDITNNGLTSIDSIPSYTANSQASVSEPVNTYNANINA